MVLDRLADLFGWDLDIDITIREVSLISIDIDKRVQIDEPVLKLNIRQLEPDTRREVFEIVRDEFDEEERMLRDSEARDVAALESGYGSDEQEILDYFEPLVSDRYITCIERGLYLRQIIRTRNLSKEEIDKRKQDIRDRFGGDGRYVANLAAAGYFDPDGGIRDLVKEVRLQQGMDPYEFQRELETLVENELACIFVDQDVTADELVREIRDRLAIHKRVQPMNSWLDVQGIGERCRETIERAMQRLEEEYLSLDYDNRKDIGEGKTVRIHTETVPQLD